MEEKSVIVKGSRLTHKKNPKFILLVKDVIPLPNLKHRQVQVVVKPVGKASPGLLDLLDLYDMNDGDVWYDEEEWADGITPLHTDFTVS